MTPIARACPRCARLCVSSHAACRRTSHEPHRPFAAADLLAKNQRKLAPWLFRAGVLIFVIYVMILPISSRLDQLPRMGRAVTDLGVGWLQNYVDLLDDDDFYVSLRNNVIWLLLYMLAPVIGLFIALFLNQNVWGIRLIKSMFFFPFVISQVVWGLSSPGSTRRVSGCFTS